MAPLPQNNTRRFFFDYITGTASTSREHTFQWRVVAAVTTSQVMSAVSSFLTSLGAHNFRVGWRVIRARAQAAGQNFSSPVLLEPAVAAFVGTDGTTDYQPRWEAVESTFQGRSPTTGRRVDLSLYRAIGDADANFRIEAGGAGLALDVNNAVQMLNDIARANAHLLAIDGTPTTWYPYMNLNYNSYWELRLRRG